MYIKKLDYFSKHRSHSRQIEIKERVIDKGKFRAEDDASNPDGVFKMSDDVINLLVLWHRRLCHPSTDRLKWNIRNTVGINLDISDVRPLACLLCDMGKSLKYASNNQSPRMQNLGEGWHCDVRNLKPMIIDRFKYFCWATEDVSRYRVFKASI